MEFTFFQYLLKMNTQSCLIYLWRVKFQNQKNSEILEIGLAKSSLTVARSKSWV